MAGLMRIVHRAGGLAAVTALAIGFTVAAVRPDVQRPPALVNVQAIGPQVGDVVPDFSLRDQPAQMRTLQSVLGKSS